MTKDELIKLLKEMNFNEKEVYLTCEPHVSTYELVNGNGVEIIQYETIISILHKEIERKYKRDGITKIYEDELKKEDD